MGPWVREYKPNPVQSSTHQQPLLFWFFFLLVFTLKCGIQLDLPLFPHQFLSQICLGHYVLLKAPLLHSIQWEIVMDPAGVCLDLMVPV